MKRHGILCNFSSENEKENDELSQLKKKCNDLENENKTLKKENGKLENDIQTDKLQIKQTLEMQNKILAKHTVLLQKLVDAVFPANEDLEIFPLKSEEELQHIDEKVDSFDKSKLLNYIKRFVGNSSNISKCVPMFFNKEFLLQINWDGYKKKLPIKSSKLFNKFVFDAVKSEKLGFIDFEAAMRKGFRNAKNNIYKLQKTSLNDEPSSQQN